VIQARVRALGTGGTDEYREMLMKQTEEYVRAELDLYQRLTQDQFTAGRPTQQAGVETDVVMAVDNVPGLFVS
jgi:hypothetical protein